MTSVLRNRLTMSRDLLKLSCLRFRHFEGYFASMHQAGNHWLRHLLAMVLSIEHGLPAPEHLADMRLIGEPRCPTQYPGLPRLVFSHKVCSTLVHTWPLRKCLSFPRYVIMVRDLRTMLVSHYERFKGRYNIPFSEYLRGDVTGDRFDCDIWDSIRFLNAWGRVQQRLPDRSCVLHFEDLQANPVQQMQRIWEFLELPVVADDVFQRAAAASTKDEMKRKELATRKFGVVIRGSGGDSRTWYSPADQDFFIDVCRNYLRYDFGYDYSRFEVAPTALRAA